MAGLSAVTSAIAPVPSLTELSEMPLPLVLNSTLRVSIVGTDEVVMTGFVLGVTLPGAEFTFEVLETTCGVLC